MFELFHCTLSKWRFIAKQKLIYSKAISLLIILMKIQRHKDRRDGRSVWHISAKKFLAFVANSNWDPTYSRVQRVDDNKRLIAPTETWFCNSVADNDPDVSIVSKVVFAICSRHIFTFFPCFLCFCNNRNRKRNIDVRKYIYLNIKWMDSPDFDEALHACVSYGSNLSVACVTCLWKNK